MQNVQLMVPAEIKTRLDEMNLLDRFLFEETCLEVPELRLQDGARRIFINTNGKNPENFSQEFLDFMTYINESTEENAKKTASEKIGKEAALLSLVKDGLLSAEEAAKRLSVTKEAVWERMKDL